MNRAHLRVSCVCLSNMNRSMEAHNALSLRGYFVRSYGTGTLVRLPGLSADRPAEFAFGTPYADMTTTLVRSSAAAYEANGVLGMLRRNAAIKTAPHRWAAAKERFDVVVCFEARVFEAVVEDFVVNRSPVAFQPAFVVNLEIPDTHSSAKVGAKITVDLIEKLDRAQNLPEEIYVIVDQIERENESKIFVVPVFY